MEKLPLRKNESNQKEIDYGCNPHHEEWSQSLVHTNPKEKLKQKNVHAVVYKMSTSETCTFF